MLRTDALSALFWLALGAGVTYAGHDLELGSLRDPGSGFLLFWVGLLMAALALIGLVKASRTAGSLPVSAPRRASRPWVPIVCVLGTLVGYAYALPRLGFVVTTTLTLAVLFRVVEPTRWSIVIPGAVATTLIAYVVFRLWLGVQLPAGLLGIG
jgi:putative tricarboxylic transport membrane protein